MKNARDLKRERKRQAQKLYKLPKGKLEPVDLSLKDHPEWMTRAFRNNRYTVMIDDNAKTDVGPAIRVMVQRHDNTPIPNHWSELQQIKNELFGAEAMGIEYYPKESELVDAHNIYWLWIFDEGDLPIPEV